MYTSTSPSSWGIVKIRSRLSLSKGYGVNVGFPERSLDSFLLLRPPMPSISQTIRSLNSQTCGYFWSDRLNFAVSQALLKVHPFLKIIFQINYLDFNHELWFSQTQLAAPPQILLNYTSQHCWEPMIEVRFHPHRQPQVVWRLRLSS